MTPVPSPPFTTFEIQRCHAPSGMRRCGARKRPCYLCLSSPQPCKMLTKELTAKTQVLLGPRQTSGAERAPRRASARRTGVDLQMQCRAARPMREPVPAGMHANTSKTCVHARPDESKHPKDLTPRSRGRISSGTGAAARRARQCAARGPAPAARAADRAPRPTARRRSVCRA